MKKHSEYEVCVSIVIPTYNRCDFILEAIKSVYSQEFDGEFEIIVVDDGSTDSTKETLISCFGNRSNFRYIYQKNSGAGYARNKGISVANGYYIALLDSDDLWHKKKLFRQVKLFEESSSVGMVGGFVEYVDVNLNPTGVIERAGKSLSHYDFCIFSAMPGAMSNVMIKKSVFDKVGGFDTSLTFGEGRELFMRISRHYAVNIVQSVTAYIRLHDNPRPYYSLSKLERDRRDICHRIPNKSIRNKCLSALYYRLFDIYMSKGFSLLSIKYLIRSLFYCPVKIHDQFPRIYPLVHRVLSFLRRFFRLK